VFKLILTIKEREFKKLVEYIKTNYGINLEHKKHLIEGRLNKVIMEKGYSNYEEYLQMVYDNPREIKGLINLLTTNHTYFMREPDHFKYIRDTILPYLEKIVQGKDLRIWSSACSTGEEPYTLAMIIADYFGDKKVVWDTKILATDISNKALETAKKGIYSAEEVEKLPEIWIKKYLKKIDENRYEVVKKIKDEVIFAPYNLMQETMPFKKKFHLILCRNVMIYFEKPTKEALIKRFYNQTEDGGYLIIGLSESFDKNIIKYRFIRPSIFRKEMINYD
jgi:chemotaxis protein methyltransferase CheR